MQSHQASRRSEDSVFNSSIRMHKSGYLSEFEHVMVAGDRWAGLNILETAYLQGFLFKVIYQTYRKYLVGMQLSKQEFFVDVRGWGGGWGLTTDWFD